MFAIRRSPIRELNAGEGSSNSSSSQEESALLHVHNGHEQAEGQNLPTLKAEDQVDADGADEEKDKKDKKEEDNKNKDCRIYYHTPEEVYEKIGEAIVCVRLIVCVLFIFHSDSLILPFSFSNFLYPFTLNTHTHALFKFFTSYVCLYT